MLQNLHASLTPDSAMDVIESSTSFIAYHSDGFVICLNLSQVISNDKVDKFLSTSAQVFHQNVWGRLGGSYLNTKFT